MDDLSIRGGAIPTIIDPAGNKTGALPTAGAGNSFEAMLSDSIQQMARLQSPEAVSTFPPDSLQEPRALLQPELSFPPPTAAEKKNPAGRVHTVRRGDTLSEIVATELKKSGITHSRRELYAAVNKLATANGLNNRHRIFPGQKIDLSALARPAIKSGETPGSASGLELQPPANGRISSFFGMRNHPVLGDELFHAGIDIALPAGTPVKPLGAGEITFAGEKSGYGLMVEVDHGNGLSSRYAHLAELLVTQGSRVESGQVIGRSGQSGMVTGPHLHLETRRQDRPVDPLSLIDREKIESGTILAETERTRPNKL